MDTLERRVTAMRRLRKPRRWWWRALGLLVLLLVAAVSVAALWLRPMATTPTAADDTMLLAVFGGHSTPGLPSHQGAARRAFHLPMRDGVDIAVDLYLPRDLTPEDRIPVIVMPTRYWRRGELRWPASAFGEAPLLTRMLVDYGYAVVSLDARGTGASFGVQNYPWAMDEIEDYLDVLDWAVQQPWSNGRAGVTGVSYGGTCAERLAALGHPALKAAVVQFALYDAYTDIAYPGGVFNAGFVGRWGRFNEALDRGRLPLFMPWYFRAMVMGPAPVDGPQGRQKLAQAQQEHEANADIYLASAGAASREKTVITERGVAVAMDDFSPHTAWKKTARAPRPAVYTWGGWFDGAYAASLLRRLCEVDAVQRAVLGPWNHGATRDADPFNSPDAPVEPSPRVQALEQIRFFDWYLKDRGEQPEPGLRYRRLGDAIWRQAAGWPTAPQTPLVFALGEGGVLEVQDRQAAMESSGEGRVLWPGPAPTGPLNRWRTQLGRGDVQYPDMGEQPEANGTGRLSWTSAPLPQPLVVEGEALLQLDVSVNATDLTLFAYLEAVTPDGRPRMLAEGQLRALHRKARPVDPAAPCAAVTPVHSFVGPDIALLTPGESAGMTIQLLPTAAQLPQGSRLRLTVTGCDTGQFTCQPYESNPPVTILPGGSLTVPTVSQE